MALEQNLVPRQSSVAIALQKPLHRIVKTVDPQRRLVMGVWFDSHPAHESKARTWLAKHGQPMYQGWVQPAALNDKRCWLNSFAVRYARADMTGDYAYCEGFAVRPAKGGWYEELHAWNLRRGHVYDPTYGFAPQARYTGVVFSDEFLRFTTFVTGYGRGLLVHFDLLWPYLDNYAATTLHKAASS